ncbi:M17 family metallopeptidase [Delftia sp. UME58]|uniref:leucyl aminopeptidase family protein n=1 Tax=Delftia sp. UME58 TaxID=1862322 RepID=UPI0016028383|nr:leucyl aminopeptidase family protein [Delftia sp. UME58]MBB1653522.1 leucyl aminopeptidase [Delftia sp. UME58]
MSSSVTTVHSDSRPGAFAISSQPATALHRATPATLAALLEQLPPAQARWARAAGFDAQPGRILLLPGMQGEGQGECTALAGVLVGVDPDQPLWQLAGLPAALPAGTYTLADADEAQRPHLLLGWALGALPSTRQARQSDAATASSLAQLVASPDEQAAVAPMAAAIGEVRRLVNLPANQLGPEQLAQAVADLAARHGARYRQWVGDELPAAGFALVHAVGRAASQAAQAPRVAELTWGDAALPHVVLIGKGVCFDSGGLDLKPAAGMRWMKKDMGGAAHALALADLLMQAGLPIHLKLLVPAVENAVGAGALRPGDIIEAGDGLRVEIENTDAEGRLLLADALHHAIRSAPTPPALLIDLATLTGAARTALGPDLPALFSNHDGWADALLAQGRAQADPLWRLPLWAPYRRMLRSDQADLLNAASTPQGGAITAALFLESFVPPELPWLHLDLFAWNLEERPGRPRGGEAQGLRALYALLSQRFASARSAFA